MKRLVLVLFLTSIPRAAHALPTLDIYGGRTDVNCTGGAKGYFYLEKISSKWWFCDPLGNGFIAMSITANVITSGTDCSGNIPQTITTAKFGDVSYNWAWQQAKRFTHWGFNSVGQDSSLHSLPGDTCVGCVWPGGVQPIKLPYIAELRPAADMADSTFGLVTSSLKDQIEGTNTHYTGYRGATLYDLFDPGLATQWQGELARSGVFSNAIRANDPYLLGVFTDDSDFFTSFGAGPDFFASGHNNVNSGFVTLITSPVQTFTPVATLNGKAIIYITPQNFTKSQALNPGSCSISAPCSLRDYLKVKYGTIGALNTAWGSNYTSFDSTGTQVTGETPGSCTASCIGDGSTTSFTMTLAHTPIDPLSVQFFVAGVAQIGDCPWFKGMTLCKTTTPNQGTLGAQTANYVTLSVSPINYATGVATISFTTAPTVGAHITVNYVYGGWMGGGTGLMDEDGTNTAWVGTNNFCLQGPNPSYPTYFTCTGGPNANATLGSDVNTWIQQFSAEYFKTMHDNLKAVSHVPYFGLDTLGSYGTPPLNSILIGAAPYVDGGFLSLLQWRHPNPAEWDSAYQFATQYFPKPFMTFDIVTAQSDSAMSCNTPNVPTEPTQAARGLAWLNNITYGFATAGFDGSIPVVGFNFWDLQDFEKQNEGLISTLNNAYDGLEALICARPCDGYYSTTLNFACGKEAANYGDAITNVTAGNALWLQ